MLPNLGCTLNHSRLQADFNVQSPPPKSLYEHWSIFKEIINSQVIDCDWHSCIVYFSENWINKLNNDHAWQDLKLYLYDLVWKGLQYDLSRDSYDITFSMIQKKRNLKPNPYLADTARHLFAIALGASPGYTPVCNEETLPIKLLQKAFVESYGLKKYYPTILHPAYFDFTKDSLPTYYSLQHPSTHIFSPKSRKASSTLLEIRELGHIVKIFASELSKEKAMCSDSIIGKIAQKLEFKYFHNEKDRHNVVSPSREIIDFDSRFCEIDPAYKLEGAKFASDAPFVRGCISITKKS